MDSSGSITSAGGTDAFVAKLDKEGRLVWSKRFGDALDQRASAIAVDGSGHVLTAGGFGAPRTSAAVP